MPAPLLWIIQIALAVVFAWAATAKLAQWKSWRSSLAAYGVRGRLAAVVAVAVPAAEAGIIALVLTGAGRVAMASVLVLVALFSLGVLRARAHRGDRLPCGCFGKTEARDYRVMLVRNALLAAMAGTVLVGSDANTALSAAEVPRAPDVLPAFLVAAGLVLAVWMLRHVTNLMRRREHM